MPIVHERIPRAASKRGNDFLLRNSIFKLRSLHDKRKTTSASSKNNQGYVNSDTATAAHLPSYLYWLFLRGGIPFEESKQLCAAGRLLLDKKAITDEKMLERQVPWREMSEMDFKVVNDRGVACDPIQRARHRTYAFMRLSKTRSLVPAEEDPKSFIHSLPFIDPIGIKSYNPLTPAGFVDTMRGLVLVSNDAHLRPLWRNEFLGNWGRYDIRFHAGCPDEAVELVKNECSRVILRRRFSKDIKVKPQVVLDRNIPNKGNDGVARMQSASPLRNDVRLIIDTPLFDFRLWSFVKYNTAICTLVKNGPFDVPVETLNTPRKLNVDELEELFAFERKLKTNKIVYGLRSLQDDAINSEDPLLNLSTSSFSQNDGTPFDSFEDVDGEEAHDSSAEDYVLGGNFDVDV